jgi:small subunit ribosomal protein S1
MSEINENPEITEVAESAAEVPATHVVRVLKETSAKADEDFDWDTFEGTKAVNSSATKKEMTDMYDNTLSILQEKEVVDGRVISMNKREVVVDIGYKSDGIVSVNEFRYNPALKIGDKVEVYVETLEDKKGQLTLSHKKARAMRSWDRVNSALENDEIITGFIKCRTKGGMIVDVFGIEARITD